MSSPLVSPRPAISGSMLFDFVRCAHRPVMDAFAPAGDREQPNDFIAMLWESGSTHEQQVVGQLQGLVSVREVDLMDRATATLKAMADGATLIHGGRLIDPVTGEVGEPDLLRKVSGGYVPGDVKAGCGEDDDGEPTVVADYAVQIAHYVRLLEAVGFSDGTRRGFVMDGKSRDVAYDLNSPRSKRNEQTWWEFFEAKHSALSNALDNPDASLPARSAACKLCPWKKVCYDQVDARDDLTRIAELGRAKRDALAPVFPTVQSLASADLDQHIQGRITGIAGIGPETLRRFQDRARLLAGRGSPYLREAVCLPSSPLEIHFDIEADPTRDLVYLHGFLVRDRTLKVSGNFRPILIDGTSRTAEEEGFASAWTFLRDQVVAGIPVFYYSPYERTAYRALARRFPSVCSETEVVDLFEQAHLIDLYAIIRSKTEWPTNDLSIKTLATYLGFRWRDSNPSGAASIEWFNELVKTGDPRVRERILFYNEDDVRASAVVADGVRALPVRPNSALTATTESTNSSAGPHLVACDNLCELL